MLAILTTHPIQYQIPIWQALARDGRVPFEVWYVTNHGVAASHDVEFRRKFSWDIDLLAGYPHRFLEMTPGSTPTSFWRCRVKERLSDRLRAAGAKVLWIQGWQVAAYWQGAWMAQSAGIECWLRGESNDLAPNRGWKRPLKKWMLGQFFQRVRRFLYIGSANRRLYQKYGVPDYRLFPAPYAIDSDRFARQAEGLRSQRAEIRRRWGIPPGAFCVLFCGKFIPKKRPLDVIEMAAKLKAENTSGPIHLLFAGSGELGETLRARCRVVYDAEIEGEKSIAANSAADLPPASFAGFLNQTEISAVYVAADCLVLPSDYGETWGLVVNEAMASGLRCLMSDRCGCAEDFENFAGNGVFACGAIGELTALILKTINSTPQPHAILSLPSFDQTVATVVSSYADVVKGGAIEASKATA